jgi:hypothetical protein
MLGREQIHNSAILKPSVCKAVQNTGRHSYADAPSKGYEQCLDCGKIKRERNQPYGLRERHIFDPRASSNLSR